MEEPYEYSFYFTKANSDTELTAVKESGGCNGEACHLKHFDEVDEFLMKIGPDWDLA